MGTPIADVHETTIDPKLCEEIIKGFEMDPRKENTSEGMTSLEIDDLFEWEKVRTILSKKMEIAFDKEYIQNVCSLEDSDVWFENTYGKTSYLLHNFEIHRLEKNIKTKYTVRHKHNGEHFTFVIFLNTIKTRESGGLNFRFSGNIHPAKTGEILIFPTGISHLYRMFEIHGKDDPESYFITGSFSEVVPDLDDHHD